MEVFDTFPVLSLPKGVAASGLAVLGDTIYVGSDDGALRVVAKKEAQGGRPTFEVRETLSRFSKERKPVRALHAVPDWNLLVFIVDGVVSGSFLNALSKPAAPLPAARGTHAVSPNCELGILCLATRTSIKLLEWQGASTTKGVSTPVFSVVTDKEITAILPPSVMFAASDRKRRGSFIGLPLPAPAAAPRAASSPLLCITTVSWVGVLLCVGVIRRADVSLHEESDDVPVVNLVGAAIRGGEEEGDEEASASLQHPVSSTGYLLSYLFLHPWTGRILREVRCGPAPPLDAFGFPVTSRREAAEGNPPTTPGAFDGPDAPGNGPTAEEGAANVSALLGGGWSSSLLAGITPALERGGSGGGGAKTNALAGGVRPVPGWAPIAVLREPASGALSLGAGRPRAGTAAGGAREGRRGSLDSVGSHDSGVDDSGGAGTGHKFVDKLGAVVVVSVCREPPPSAVDADGVPIHSPVPGLYMVGTTLAADGTPPKSIRAGGAAPGPGADASASSLSEGTATPVAFSSYPTSLYASASFPYVLAAQADGLVVYNARTGSAVQRVKLPNVRGFASCPEEVRARLNFAAGKIPGLGGSSGPAGPDSAAPGGMTPEYIVRVVSQPERLYAFVGGGVVMLRMVPVVMQVAALISARPPEFEAALALCEHFRAIRMRVRDVESAQRALADAREGSLPASAASSRRPSLEESGAPPTAEGGAKGAGTSAGRQLVTAAAAAAAASTTPQARGSSRPVESDDEPDGSGGEDGGAGEGGRGSGGNSSASAARRGRALDEDAGEEDDRAFKALGGVPGSKIRHIRAQFGYQLFARGDFGQALFHLSHAGEPPASILSLFPQLLPTGVQLRPQLPVSMPVMIDATLPAAVKPLIPYLLLQRRRLKCHTGRVLVQDDPALPGEAVEAAGAATASARTNAVTVPSAPGGTHIRDLLSLRALHGTGGDATSAAPARRLPSAVLVDTVLLIAFLWNEAQIAAECTALAAGAPGPLPPSSSASYMAALRAELNKMRRGTDRLLASPNCVDLEEAEVQLRAFRGDSGGELVTLFRGKGAHESAVRILARTAEDALYAAVVLRHEQLRVVHDGHPSATAAAVTAARGHAPAARDHEVDASVEEAVTSCAAAAASARDTLLQRVHTLTAYLRVVGHPHEGLVLAHLRALLEGGTLAGVEGVLLGLAALMPPMSLLRRGATEAAAAAARAAASSSRAGASDAYYTAARKQPFSALEPEAVVAFLAGLSCQFGCVSAAAAVAALAADEDLDGADEGHRSERGRSMSSGGGSVLDLSASLEHGILRAMWRLRGSTTLPSDADAERLTTLLFAPTEAEGGLDDDPDVPDGEPAARDWSCHLLIVYLEYVVYACGDAGLVPPATINWAADLLVKQYLGVCASLVARAPSLLAGVCQTAAAQGGRLGVYRRRLVHLLQHKPAFCIDDAAALAMLPGGRDGDPGVAFSQERVLLLRQLGQHETALRILVRSLGDYAAAEAYCAEVRRDAEERAVSSAVSLSSSSVQHGGRVGAGPLSANAATGNPLTSAAAVAAAVTAAAGSAASASRLHDTPEKRALDMDVYNALLRAYLNTAPSAASAAGSPAPAAGGGDPGSGRGVLLLPSLQRLSRDTPGNAMLQNGVGGHVASAASSSLPLSLVADIADDEQPLHVVGAGELHKSRAEAALHGSLRAPPSALSVALLGYHPPSAAPHGPNTPAAAPAAAALPLAPTLTGPSASASPSTSGGVVAQVMDIMSRNFNRVDASAALGALPPSLPLSAVAPFLVSAIRHSQDSVRAVAVAEQLNNVTHLKARSELLERQSRCTVVERNTTCNVCKRRLAAGGNLSVFSSLPDGKIVHLACVKK